MPAKGQHISPEHKARISISNKGKVRSPETLARMSLAKKGKQLSPETKAKISASLKGKIGPWRGKQFSQEHRARISTSMKGKIALWKFKPHSPEHKARISEALKGKPKSPESVAKTALANRGKHFSPEHKAKISTSLKKRYEDPLWKEAKLQQLLSSSSKRPNGIEKKVISFISKHSLPYKYTGNGEVWINGQNPDFINVNGQKTVIEIQGCYWHGCKTCGYGDNVTETKRRENYANFGFKMMEIWEHDVKDEQKLMAVLSVAGMRDTQDVRANGPDGNNQGTNGGVEWLKCCRS